MNHDSKNTTLFSRPAARAQRLAATLVLGTSLGGFGQCAEVPTCECDAAITKLPTSDFPRGGTGTFAIVVDYFGHPLCKDGRVCVDDVLPAGLTFHSTASTGWTCSGTTTVHCCYSGTLPTTHTALPVLTLVVDVSKKAPDVIKNCATIEQGKKGDFTDSDPDNNKSCTKADVTDPCPPLRADLSSGIQDGAGALAIGAQDDTWSIVASPGSTTIVAPLVLQPNAAWHAPPPGSRWIGPKDPAPGDYTYETCFCLHDGFSSPQLDLTMLGDNQITNVALNGCDLLATPGGTFNGVPVHVQAPDSECFQAGENCVDITVHNIGGPTGLAVAGSVIAENGLCCE